MQNDAPFNVILARFIITDGGVDPSKHENVAPTTASIMGFFMAPGRAGSGAAAQLRHDLERASAGLMFLTDAISVLAALAALWSVRDRGGSLRVVVGLSAGIVPWTWAV